MAEKAAQTRVVVMGMMGAGKSSVGRALADRIGWPYMDNDELVLAATGRSSEEIDADDGADALHDAEAAALRHALAMPPPLIAGAAASVVTDHASRALLRTATAVVYLRARPETLLARIGSGGGRRDDATDLAWLQASFAERDSVYRETATLTIDTDGFDVETVAGIILGALERG